MTLHLTWPYIENFIYGYHILRDFQKPHRIFSQTMTLVGITNSKVFAN